LMAVASVSASVTPDRFTETLTLLASEKPPPVKATIALLWKRPHLAAEVIPRRNLSTHNVPKVYVVATPFPPDDRSVGYERGTSVSREWDEAETSAAIEASGYVSANLSELSGVSSDDSERAPRLREFCARFAERAFRRPLTDEQKRLFVERQFEKAPDPDTAVKRVVLLVLKSPRFLYHELDSGLDAYDVAARISFALWDSLPDEELLQAAACGQLATREQVRRQAERMVTDPRARSKLREFFLQWLKIDLYPDLQKDRARFPDFDEAIATDLRTSLELFLDDVAWSDASDFRQLLLGDFLYLNGRLARFYGADLAPDAPFQKVSFEPTERAGVLSHPYLMACFAYTGTSSPIHRGVFLARNVLGKTLSPPPQAVTPFAPELHPNLTTRERVALQTSPKTCMTCHTMINPLGFTMEHFDAVGRYQSEERGRPIDASGFYLTHTGETAKFAGVRNLAAFLAQSEETHSAFVERLFQYLVKQPIRAYGSQELPDLLQYFSGHEFQIRKLMVEIVATSALTAPETETPGRLARRQDVVKPRAFYSALLKVLTARVRFASSLPEH